MSTQSFHNTVNESGQTLIGFEKKAKGQELDVLDIFKSKYSVTLTPEMALTWLRSRYPKAYANTPITSIRRAFSNLKNRGKIYRLETKIYGDFGKKVHCWKKC